VEEGVVVDVDQVDDDDSDVDLDRSRADAFEGAALVDEDARRRR
jgi:hypothetical protein